MSFSPVILLAVLAVVPARSAQGQAARDAGAPAPANRAVYLDKDGVVRWSDDRQEVTA